MKKYVFAFTLCATAAMADVAQVVQTAKQVLSAKEAVEELVKIEQSREKIYKKTAEENEKLQKKEKEKEAQGQQMVNEINKVKDEVALLADGKEKKEKEELVKFKIKEFRDFSNQTRATLLQERNNIGKNLFEEIKTQIAEIAKAEGYDMILNDKSLVFSNQSFDITAKVLEKINKGKPAAEAKK